MVPPQLIDEVAELARSGAEITVHESDGWAKIVYKKYRVPPGFTKKETELLLLFPLAYPNGQPDMFWVDHDLVLHGGGIPERADQIEQHLNKQWRRFSWHPQKWNPGVDDLRTYLEFVNARLAKGV